MIKEKIKIQNKLGLHARPASLLVQTASKFDSNIHIVKNSQKVNCKSILGIMMLAAGYGSELEIWVEGKDESLAFESIVGLINNKFEEE
jgi:phosphocarrier protein HPr